MAEGHGWVAVSTHGEDPRVMPRFWGAYPRMAWIYGEARPAVDPRHAWMEFMAKACEPRFAPTRSVSIRTHQVRSDRVVPSRSTPCVDGGHGKSTRTKVRTHNEARPAVDPRHAWMEFMAKACEPRFAPIRSVSVRTHQVRSDRVVPSRSTPCVDGGHGKSMRTKVRTHQVSVGSHPPRGLQLSRPTAAAVPSAARTPSIPVRHPVRPRR